MNVQMWYSVNWSFISNVSICHLRNPRPWWRSRHWSGSSSTNSLSCHGKEIKNFCQYMAVWQWINSIVQLYKSDPSFTLTYDHLILPWNPIGKVHELWSWSPLVNFVTKRSPRCIVTWTAKDLWQICGKQHRTYQTYRKTWTISWANQRQAQEAQTPANLASVNHNVKEMPTTEVVAFVAVPLVGQTTGRSQPKLHYMSIKCKHVYHYMQICSTISFWSSSFSHWCVQDTSAGSKNTCQSDMLELCFARRSLGDRFFLRPKSSWNYHCSRILWQRPCASVRHHFLLFLSKSYTPVVSTCSERTRPFSPTRSAAYTWHSVRDRRFANAQSVSLW